MDKKCCAPSLGFLVFVLYAGQKAALVFAEVSGFKPGWVVKVAYNSGVYLMDNTRWISNYINFFYNIWWIFLSDGYYWLFVMCLVGPECSPSTSLGLSGACWGLPKAWSVIFSNCWLLTHLQCETPGWFIEAGTSNQPLKWIFFAGKDTRSFMPLNNLHQFLWTEFSLCR